MGPSSGIRPHPAYDVPGEADLVGRICEILAFRPIEVNNLSSRFATVFNQVVRNNERTPFSPDRRNDGSFKKWLLACGFEVGPLFDRNKSLVYLPQHSRQTSEAPRRRLYRGKNDKTGLQNSYTGTTCPPEGRPNRRWEVKHENDFQPQDQLSMLMAAACFLAPTLAPQCAEAVDPDQHMEEAHQSLDMAQTSEPEPEQSEPARDMANEQDVTNDGDPQQGREGREGADFSEEEDEAALEGTDGATSQAAWVEVQSAFGELDEADFVMVGDIGSWEEVPKKQENFQSHEGAEDDGLSRWSIEG